MDKSRDRAEKNEKAHRPGQFCERTSYNDSDYDNGTNDDNNITIVKIIYKNITRFKTERNKR